MASLHISLLLCGHSAIYDPPPEPGDSVYCRRCGRYSLVKITNQEWSWKCPTCHTSRPFGVNETEARAAGRRHQRKYHHVVFLRHGYNVVEEIGPEREGELSVAGETIEWLRTHQGSLRAAVERRIVQNGQSTMDRK